MSLPKYICRTGERGPLSCNMASKEVTSSSIPNGSLGSPGTPIRDEADRQLLEDLILSDDSEIRTPGRNIVIKGAPCSQVNISMDNKTVGKGQHCFPGQFNPYTGQIHMAGKSTASGAPTSRVARATDTPERRRSHLSKTKTTTMREKQAPRRSPRGIPVQKTKRPAPDPKPEPSGTPVTRKKKRIKTPLPPRVSDGGLSDDEAWIEPEGVPIDWYVNHVNTKILDLSIPEEQRRALTQSWESWDPQKVCGLLQCPTASKIFPTAARYARHLVEDHLEERPLFGCSEECGSKVCLTDQGHRFQHVRRSELVRHLAVSHNLGTIRAVDYVKTIFRYKTREECPKGTVYPRTIFFRMVRNPNAPPLAIELKKPKEETVITEPVVDPSPTTPIQEHMDIPTPSSEVRADPVMVLSFPEPEWKDYKGSVMENCYKNFVSSWTDVTEQAVKCMGHTLTAIHTHGERVLRDEMEKELRAETEKIGKKDEEIDNLKNEVKRLKAENQELRDEVRYANLTVETVEARYKKMDRKFAKATGMTLEGWDGKTHSLLAACSVKTE